MKNVVIAFKDVLKPPEVNQVVVFMDVTNTITNDEQIIRKCIENVCARIGAEQAVDWKKWQGIGNRAIFDDLVGQGYITPENVGRVQNAFLTTGMKIHRIEDLRLTADDTMAMDWKTRQDTTFKVFNVLFQSLYERAIFEENQLELREGVKDFFDACAARSVPIIPITNDEERLLFFKRYRLGLHVHAGIHSRSGTFPHYVGPEAVNGKTKPDPAPVLLGVKRAEDEFYQQPLHFIMIGDSEADMRSAYEAGLRMMGGPHSLVHRVQYLTDKEELPRSSYATEVVTETNVASRMVALIDELRYPEAQPAIPKPFGARVPADKARPS